MHRVSHLPLRTTAKTQGLKLRILAGFNVIYGLLGVLSSLYLKNMAGIAVSIWVCVAGGALWCGGPKLSAIIASQISRIKIAGKGKRARQ